MDDEKDRAGDRQRSLENARKDQALIQETADTSRAKTLAKRVQQRRANEEAMGTKPRGFSCSAQTPRCPEARVMQLDTPECCKKHIRKITRDLARLFDREGIRWWIDYGTLLGYLKFDGGLIPWDKDGDWGILAADRPKLLALLPELLALGYHPTYAPPRPTERFRTGDRVKVRLSKRNSTNIDVFIWEHRQMKWRGKRCSMLDRINYIGADLYKGREFPEEWALPLERGEWEGIDVSVPKEARKLAAHRYGADWEKPLRVKHPWEPRD